MAFLIVVGSTKPLLRLLLDTIASLKHSLSFSSMFFDASRSTLKHKEPVCEFFYYSFLETTASD